MLIFRSNDSQGTKTQFVVTLDSLEYPGKKRLLQNERGSKTPPSTVGVKRVRVNTERVQSSVANKVVVKTELDEENELRKAVEKSTETTKSRNVRKTAAATSSPNEKSPTNEFKRKRTPIKFDIDDDKREDRDEPSAKRRSKSSERKNNDDDKNRRRSSEKDGRDRSRDRDELSTSSKIRTSKSSSQKKYDNLPPCK